MQIMGNGSGILTQDSFTYKEKLYILSTLNDFACTVMSSAPDQLGTVNHASHLHRYQENGFTGL